MVGRLCLTTSLKATMVRKSVMVLARRSDPDGSTAMARKDSIITSSCQQSVTACHNSTHAERRGEGEK